MREDWHEYFLGLAEYVATRSKDPDTKVGAVFAREKRVLVTGYNGIPRLVADTPERTTRPGKYTWMEHAERNAIYNAAYNGINIAQSVCYTTLPPCVECARGLIQTGITAVYTTDTHVKSHWLDAMKTAEEMLREASIPLIRL